MGASMIVRILKATSSTFECENRNCQKLPKYVVIGSFGRLRIKKNSIYIKIGYGIFCGGCIDEVYNEVKLKLNKKLWAFQ